ncbi:hypothetical protein NS228_05660 [Methylobacterium indicum]|uniref:Uncharacterized protein n=1 Tax=Methylobacterium indicum TaxID=1775910 RepID=A0A0J6RJF6_9HYPH|nr:hypothetical protein [Methylobacterium indicum]KMO10214.1 hypothetical protein QR78_30475 [Methylobacterium indicum]KMO21367.1 hypothetical protein QR79_16920 [Methylobacterium indicum]KTS19454.1 hypothetical protein NS229_25695 [Methylobacterium indicum]KTS41663.1 hypothetical protein NS228_05660 [Methylobacterium indicum]KTS45803.1 hypothetical protein NS230_23145 [Methylobacterium indicum]
MSTSTKTDAADRHHGGPGSSHQRSDRPDPTADTGPTPGSATSDSRSHVSGGGGERDRHHAHDPDRKAHSPRSH